MSEPISIEEELKRNGKIVYKIKGQSMYPMLRQDKDLVVITKNTGMIHPGDVVLYKRIKDNALILHRVLKTDGNHLIIRGDHIFTNENVHVSQIIGILDSYIRNGKTIKCNSRTDNAYRSILPFLRIITLTKQRIIRTVKSIIRL